MQARWVPSFLATKKKPVPASDEEGLMMLVANTLNIYLSMAFHLCWESENRHPQEELCWEEWELTSHKDDKGERAFLRLGKQGLEVDVVMRNDREVRNLFSWPEARVGQRADCKQEARQRWLHSNGVVSQVYVWVVADKPWTPENQLALSLVHDVEGNLFGVVSREGLGVG